MESKSLIDNYKHQGIIDSLRQELSKHSHWENDKHVVNPPSFKTGVHSSKNKHFIHQLLKRRPGETKALETVRKVAKESKNKKN